MIGFLIGGLFITASFFLKFSFPIDIRSGHHMWFSLFSFVIILITGKPSKKSWPLVYFLFASFLIPSNFYNGYTFLQWLPQSLAVILYLKLENITLDRKFLEKLFAYCCLVQAAWVLVDKAGFDIYGTILGSVFDGVQKTTKAGVPWNEKAVTGSLGHPTLSGAYMGILLPFVYRLKKYLIFLPVLAIHYTQSSMAALTAYVVILYIATYDSRFKYHLFFCHCVALALLLHHGNTHGGFFSDSARLEFWRVALAKHGLASPVFGNGPGFIEIAGVQLSKNSEVLRPEHNEILTLYFQYGLIGIAILIYIIRLKVVEFYKEKDVYFKGALVGLVFNSLGNFPLHIASTGTIFIILVSQLNKEKKHGGISF